VIHHWQDWRIVHLVNPWKHASYDTSTFSVAYQLTTLSLLIKKAIPVHSPGSFFLSIH
jgi:hypothetical protein